MMYVWPQETEAAEIVARGPFRKVEGPFAWPYFGGGYLYNVKRNGLSGSEAIPNHGFWTALPGLIKDGCGFTWAKLRSGSSGEGSYASLD